ncbi:pol polyprotein [Tanacetum coccineum]
MGSKLLNSCEPVGPEDTNAAPKARLCVYLFAADFISKVPDYLIGPDDGEVLTHCGIQRMMNTGPTPPVNETGAPVTNAGENTHQVEPPAEGQPSNAQAVKAMEAWKHSDFLCHNYVLNGLVDSLYNVYCKTTTTKELWESLERKYKTKDAGTKKFVVAQFLDYKIADSKNVDAIIEKLPQSWVEFKNYLKHKQKEMSVKELVVHLRIEEDNKLAQKNTFTPDSAKANMVEHAGSSARSNLKGKGKDEKKNDKKGKGKAEYLAPKAIIVKQKFQGTFYNCNQSGHHATNCKIPKRATPRQAIMVNDNMDMLAIVSDVIAMISEVNLVGSNNSGWWVDTRETRHVCADKGMFHSFRAVDNGEKLYMGNSATADIKGEGDVILKMTFEKELKLTNVLYVPEIRKNLVSCLLLNKFGFCLVFESDKFVLSKNQMYVGKGYAVNGMFKLNIMVVKNDINKMNSSVYLIESSNMWHGRLGHYCYVYLLKSKDEAIDKFVLYKTEVKNQLGRKIKVVQSDRGGEYVSPSVELCAKHGIRHEFIASYSP